MERTIVPETVQQQKDSHLEAYERLRAHLPGARTPWVRDLRAKAAARFAETGFPSPKDEQWKYTNVADIARTPWRVVAAAERHAVTPAEVEAHALGLRGPRLVLVDGHVAPDLSSLAGLPAGVRVEGLAAVLDKDPDAARDHLGKHAPFDGRGFVALNTALAQDGAFVHVPDGVVVERPILVLHLSTGRAGAVASHVRNLVVVGEHAQATVVEAYAALGPERYLVNAVTEAVAGPAAVLDHYRIQRESAAGRHVSTVELHQGRASNVTNHAISLSGGLVRNQLNAVLDGEGAECVLDGLYAADGDEHVDNHTQIDHVKAHCASRELYKGILAGRARGVFHGKIYVHPGAQKTDAKQTNKNLLLSEDALVDSTPMLEIFADDVKCTHGSTTGQLSAEQVFYLRARGIPEATARSLLTYAFVKEVVDRVRPEALRESLDALLLSWLPHGEDIREAAG